MFKLNYFILVDLRYPRISLISIISNNHFVYLKQYYRDSAYISTRESQDCSLFPEPSLYHSERSFNYVGATSY